MDMKKTAVIIAITAALSCTAFANDKLCAVNNTGDKNSAVMVPLRERLKNSVMMLNGTAKKELPRLPTEALKLGHVLM
jgi:hypothetical protein